MCMGKMVICKKYGLIKNANKKTDLNHLGNKPDKNALIWRWKSYKKNEE